MDITIQPNDGCVCPRQSYTCAAHLVIGMSWITASNPDGTVDYNTFQPSRQPSVVKDGLQYVFSEEVVGSAANITSQLFIINIQRNGTIVTCEAFIIGSHSNVTAMVCVAGKSLHVMIHSIYCRFLQ